MQPPLILVAGQSRRAHTLPCSPTGTMLVRCALTALLLAHAAAVKASSSTPAVMANSRRHLKVQHECTVAQLCTGMMQVA